MLATDFSRRCSCMVLAALLAGCAAVPTRHPRSLYDQLGGSNGLAVRTDASIDHYAADPRVARTFAQADISRFRRMFAQYLCALCGGPCRYKGDSISEVHRGMHLGDAQFNALVQDFTAATTSLHLPVRGRTVCSSDWLRSTNR